MGWTWWLPHIRIQKPSSTTSRKLQKTTNKKKLMTKSFLLVAFKTHLINSIMCKWTKTKNTRWEINLFQLELFNKLLLKKCKYKKWTIRHQIFCETLWFHKSCYTTQEALISTFIPIMINSIPYNMLIKRIRIFYSTLLPHILLLKFTWTWTKVLKDLKLPEVFSIIINPRAWIHLHP
jgi:hypothetical protein